MRHMLNVSSLASIVAIALALSAGCGVDEANSAKVWNSIQSSLGKSAGGNSKSQALTVTSDGGFRVDCRESGSAELTTKLDVNTTDDTANVLFGYEVDYNACKPDENTLDGSFTYAASLVAQSDPGAASAHLHTRYSGSVTSSGESNGTCDVDVTGDVLA
ncbi:MAG TPA: hypothetical protein VGO62_14960, partial [Myxococcota bacterium]